MPSPLDLLGPGDTAVPPLPGDDVLDSVKAEGARRRAGRHRRNLGLGLAALTVVMASAVTLRPDGGGRPQVVDVAAGGGEPVAATDPTSIDSNEVIPELFPGDVPTTTAAPAAPPPVPPPTLPPESSTTPTPVGPSVTTAVTAAPTTAPPTTAAKVCRNSSDQACGEFRWDPAPEPNQPLVATFTKAPATAKVGEPVLFEVTWSDGDAPLTFDRLSHDGTGMVKACSLTPRYGPWTPPARVPSGGVLPYTTTFAAPGTYAVKAELGTAECDSPYGSDTSIAVTITVGAS